jgi:S1-C subfamily serine protease
MLADEEPKAGSAVFALGNPKGLERTISQGLFTGHREIQGRRLVQISAPISPGSSGGPILNSEGKLIAVAVGSFSAGQNLNFAVPLAIVRTFLTPGTRALFTCTQYSAMVLLAPRR